MCPLRASCWRRILCNTRQGTKQHGERREDPHPSVASPARWFPVQHYATFGGNRFPDLPGAIFPNLTSRARMAAMLRLCFLAIS